MGNFNALVEDTASQIKLPLDHLLCIEEELSLVERFKLKEVIKSRKAKQATTYFSEFIKGIPECDPNPEAIYEKIMNQ